MLTSGVLEQSFSLALLGSLGRNDWQGAANTPPYAEALRGWYQLWLPLLLLFPSRLALPKGHIGAWSQFTSMMAILGTPSDAA